MVCAPVKEEEEGRGDWSAVGKKSARSRFSSGEVAGLLLRSRGLHSGLAAICRSRVP